jgi:hypothetical protein
MKRLALLLIAAILFGYSNIVLASFGVNQDMETFEGAIFPPTGWSVTIYNGYGNTLGMWAQTSSSSYGGNGSYVAASDYGAFLLDTSLISPAFSTMSFSDVKVEFFGYFYFYSGYGTICDLQYTINDGSNWITFKTWDTYGSPTNESIALPAEALGQANVKLRWKHYTAGWADYWAVVDDVKLTAPTAPVSIPTMTEWGMMIMMSLLGGVSIYYLRRQKAAI